MGQYMKKIALQAGQRPAHELDIAADSTAALQILPQQTKAFDNLVAEAGALYGARHYRDYHFLLTLSDHVAHFGLEHHESNDSRVGEGYLTDNTQWTLGAVAAAARIHALLEWQIPPSGGIGDAGITKRRWKAICSGFMRG